jgi:hypothetical protein
VKRLLAIAVLWIAGVAAWWWMAVPLEPEYVIATDGQGGPFSMRQGEFLTTGFTKRPKDQGGSRLHGPVEVREDRTGRVVRRYLDSQDEIVAFNFAKGETIAVRREESLQVVRLSDGSTVCEIKPFPVAKEFRFTAQGRLLTAGNDGNVAAFDTANGQLKWTRSDLTIDYHDVGPNLILASSWSASQRKVEGLGSSDLLQMTHCHLLAAETGDPDLILGEHESLAPIAVSADGRWVAIQPIKGRLTIHEARSGIVSGKLSIPLSNLVWFNAEGTELQVPYRSFEGPMGVARWNASDGAVIEPFGEKAGNADLKLSADGRYGVELRQHWIIPKVFRDYALKYKWSRFVDLLSPKVALIAFDLQQQRILGTLPADDRWVSDADHGRGFLCRRGRDAIAFYTFPPGRNWSWLIGWSLGPVVGIYLAIWLRKRRALQSSQAAAAEAMGPGVD